jgi:hypothetical protein
MASSSVKDVPLPTGLTSLEGRLRLEEKDGALEELFLKDCVRL